MRSLLAVFTLFTNMKSADDCCHSFADVADFVDRQRGFIVSYRQTCAEEKCQAPEPQDVC